MDNYWTEERQKRAVELWHAGKSGSEIATALGGVTRNAVIGKINRLQLAGKAEARKARSPRPPRPERAPPAVAPALSRIRRAIPHHPPAEAVMAAHEAVTAPSFRSVKLHELEANECHWPVTSGHGPAVFCGCSTARLEIFCPYHAKLAYQPRQATRGGR